MPTFWLAPLGGRGFAADLYAHRSLVGSVGGCGHKPELKSRAALAGGNLSTGVTPAAQASGRSLPLGAVGSGLLHRGLVALGGVPLSAPYDLLAGGIRDTEWRKTTEPQGSALRRFATLPVCGRCAQNLIRWLG